MEGIDLKEAALLLFGIVCCWATVNAAKYSSVELAGGALKLGAKLRGDTGRGRFTPTGGGAPGSPGLTNSS